MTWLGFIRSASYEVKKTWLVIITVVLGAEHSCCVNDIASIELRSPDHEFDFRGCNPFQSSTSSSPLGSAGNSDGLWDARSDDLRAFSCSQDGAVAVTCAYDEEGIDLHSPLGAAILINSTRNGHHSPTSSLPREVAPRFSDLTIEVMFRFHCQSEHDSAAEAHQTLLDWDADFGKEPPEGASCARSRLLVVVNPNQKRLSSCDGRPQTDWIHAVIVVHGESGDQSPSLSRVSVHTDGVLSVGSGGRSHPSEEHGGGSPLVEALLVTDHDDTLFFENHTAATAAAQMQNSRGLLARKKSEGSSAKPSDDDDETEEDDEEGGGCGCSSSTSFSVARDWHGANLHFLGGSSVHTRTALERWQAIKKAAAETEDEEADDHAVSGGKRLSPPSSSSSSSSSFRGTVGYLRVWAGEDGALSSEQAMALHSHSHRLRSSTPQPVVVLLPPPASEATEHDGGGTPTTASTTTAAAAPTMKSRSSSSEGRQEGEEEEDESSVSRRGEGEREEEEGPCVVAVCLTGGIRAMAAPSVQTSFLTAMAQLSGGGGECEVELFAHVSIGSAAVNRDQSAFATSEAQAWRVIRALNESSVGGGGSAGGGGRGRGRVKGVRFFDDAAHYPIPNRCRSGLPPLPAYPQLYKVAECYHTMALPRERALASASSSSPSSSSRFRQYRWVVRSRWDIGFVTPLPPLGSLSPHHVHVPYNYWPFTDQFALVPRSFAPAYFTAINSFYKCSRAAWFPRGLGAADMLLAKHLMEETNVPVMLSEIHAPVVRLGGGGAADVSGWCYSQLMSPWLLASFMVDVYAHQAGVGAKLKDALQLALRCVCEHRFRDSNFEFELDLLLNGAESSMATTNESSAHPLTTESTATTRPPPPPSPPLSCGNVNHLLEEEGKEGEELIPAQATATWASQPTFQLGHSDFNGQHHAAVLQFNHLHPSQLYAVVDALREVVSSLSRVLQCTLDDHLALSAPPLAPHHNDLAAAGSGSASQRDRQGVGCPAEAAYAAAVEKYSVAMQEAMIDSTYKVVLRHDTTDDLPP